MNNKTKFKIIQNVLAFHSAQDNNTYKLVAFTKHILNKTNRIATHIWWINIKYQTLDRIVKDGIDRAFLNKKKTPFNILHTLHNNHNFHLFKHKRLKFHLILASLRLNNSHCPIEWIQTHPNHLIERKQVYLGAKVEEIINHYSKPIIYWVGAIQRTVNSSLQRQQET